MKKWYVLISLGMVFTIQGMDRQLRRSDNSIDALFDGPLSRQGKAKSPVDDSFVLEKYSQAQLDTNEMSTDCDKKMVKKHEELSRLLDSSEQELVNLRGRIKIMDDLILVLGNAVGNTTVSGNTIKELDNVTELRSSAELFNKAEVLSAALGGCGLYAIRKYCNPRVQSPVVEHAVYSVATAATALVAWKLWQQESRWAKMSGAVSVGLSGLCLYGTLKK